MVIINCPLWKFWTRSNYCTFKYYEINIFNRNYGIIRFIFALHNYQSIAQSITLNCLFDTTVPRIKNWNFILSNFLYKPLDERVIDLVASWINRKSPFDKQINVFKQSSQLEWFAFKIGFSVYKRIMFKFTG